MQMKEKEQPGTEGINYFIVDLVVTLLSWSTSATPQVSCCCYQIRANEIFCQTSHIYYNIQCSFALHVIRNDTTLVLNIY